MIRPGRMAALIGAACALLSACGALHSNVVLRQTYVLRAAAPPATATPAGGGATLQVLRPFPAPGLESDHIILVRSDRRLDYFEGSRWAAPLPDVVAALVAETFRASGSFGSVQDERAPLAADYLLRIAVRHFEAQYAGEAAPRVLVTFDCIVARRIDRGTVASFSVEGASNADANRLGAVVAAFEQASQAAIAQALDATRAAIAGTVASAPARADAAP
jgi:cholesterol transport system auxiliary component